MTLALSKAPCLLLALALAQADPTTVATEGGWVVPPGTEDHVRSLLGPWMDGREVDGAKVDGVSVQGGRLVVALKGPSGGGGQLVLLHRDVAREGDETSKSFSMRFDGDVRVEGLASRVMEAVRDNDDGTFAWRRLGGGVRGPPPPEPSFSLPGWLAGTGAAMLLWLALLGLAAAAAIRTRGHWRVPSDPWAWGLLGVVIAGAVARLVIAPEALYKEAHPFRGLEAAFTPVLQAVDARQYPPGYPALLQLLHGLTGVHPARLLFGANVAFGCALPAAAGWVGWQLTRTLRGATLTASVAAFLPHAIKLSHSEVLLGPFATLQLMAMALAPLAFRSGAGSVGAGVSAGMLAHIRPEGALAWPGLLLLAMSGMPPELGRRARRRRLLRTLGLALVTAMPALLRVVFLELAGEGLRSDTGPPLTLVGGLATIQTKVLSVSGNVFADPSITPPLVMGLGAIGVFALLRRGIAGLGVLAIGVPLMCLYALLESSVPRFGEMRYQLAVVPAVVVAAGFAAEAICARMSIVRGRVAAVAIAIALVGSALPYVGLVRWAEHPQQQEYEVLREHVLTHEAAWALGGVVLFGDRVEHVHFDLMPDAMRPLLVHPGYEMSSGRWRDLRSAVRNAGPSDTILVYRGLHSAYLGGTEEAADAAFWEAIERQGVGRPDTRDGPRLVPVFEELCPFVPHHELLDSERTEGSFVVALYRLDAPKGPKAQR